MNLISKTGVAVSLLVASFSAVAQQDIPCPTVEQVVSAADLLESVSLVAKMEDEREPYIVFNINPLQTEKRWWHILTPSNLNDMDEALVSSKELVKTASSSLSDVAFEFDENLLMCAYHTPQDKEDDVGIIAVSFRFEGAEDQSFLSSHLKMANLGGKTKFTFMHK